MLDDETLSILGRLRGSPVDGLKSVQVPEMSATFYGKTIVEAKSKARTALNIYNQRNGTSWSLAMQKSMGRSRKRGARVQAH